MSKSQEIENIKKDIEITELLNELSTYVQMYKDQVETIKKYENWVERKNRKIKSLKLSESQLARELSQFRKAERTLTIFEAQIARVIQWLVFRIISFFAFFIVFFKRLFRRRWNSTH